MRAADTAGGGLLRHFMTPGNVAQGLQTETPGVMTEEDAFRQNQLEDQAAKFGTQQAFNTVFGNVPMSQAGALGVGGGAIKAYHGSPYDFEKFDLSKIGTGEGAQAYGHGLYFAENPETALSYRNQLAPRDVAVKFPDRSFDPLQSEDYIDRAAAGELIESPHASFDQAISRLRDKAKQYADPTYPDRVLLDHVANRIDEWKKSGAKLEANDPGRMYEVNINADPEHFLDWDKPLSEQHPKVQEAIRKAGLAPTEPDLGSFAGNPVSGVPRWADTPEQMHQLREAGIPGIKYLDQGSRGPSTIYNVGAPRSDFGPYSPFTNRADAQAHMDMLRRQGFHDAEIREQAQPQTSNYVVFNDKLIDIIKKYGLAGLVAGGGAHFTTTPVDHNPFAAQQ